MRTLLRILSISDAEIGERAGVTRQTAHRGLKDNSGPCVYIARQMVAAARKRPGVVAKAIKIRDELNEFIDS